MKSLNTLLLSGASIHDWERSTPFVSRLLEDSGRFTVTTTTDPSDALEDAGQLAQYDLLFTEYSGPDWSDAARQNFERAIASGTGLVVLHSANNAFSGWVEYEKMIGLLWREGSNHGDYHEFVVRIVDRQHPITAGLEDFRQWDELYHNLLHMHEVPVHVLATAYSSPDRHGTGKDEPMMAVTQYGEGRVFHMVLGHVALVYPEGATMRSLENPPFQRALLRGSEWAATGTVTL
jgi:uncharacterized protein